MSCPPGTTTTRAQICRLLEGEPTARQLRARIGAVERLRHDIAHIVGWPALAASLNEDVQRLRCKLGEHVR